MLKNPIVNRCVNNWKGGKMRYRMDYTLFKRKMPSGKTVYYYAVYDEDGKRIFRSTGEKTKALADKYVRDLADHGRLGVKDRSLVTLNDYTRDFFVHGVCPIEKYNHSRGRSMTRSTLSVRRTALTEHILPHLGKYPVCNITPARINNWLIELPETDKVSRSTANSFLVALRNVLQQAVRDGIIVKNPAIGVENLGNDTKIRKAFTIKEVKAIIGKPGDWKNPMIRSMCILAASTGMRMGEVRALRADCISEDAVIIKASFSNIDGYKTPKNGKERISPLPPGIYTEVMRYAWSDEGFVFRTWKEDDKPISANWVKKSLDTRMEELKIKGKSFHSFRSFFNTQMVSANVDSEAIRAVIGHATESMTMRYLHMDAAEFPELRKAQEEIVNEILA